MSDMKIIVDSSQVTQAGTEIQKITAHMSQFRTRMVAMGNEARKNAGAVSRLGNSLSQAARQQQQMERATNKSSQALQRNTRRMGRGQVAIQQFGYQAGDFIVQVQSGTNAFVAFGQQATQMAGLLTLAGGSMVAIGAALSVIIPLATAAGAAFMRTRKGAEEAGEELREVTQVLRDIETLEDITVNIDTNVSENFGEVLELLRYGLSRELADSLATFRKEFEEAFIPDLSGAEANIDRLQERLEELRNSIAVSSGQQDLIDQNITAITEQIERQTQSVQEQSDLWAIINSISGQTREQLAQSLNVALQRLETEGLLTRAIQDQLYAFAEANGILSIMDGLMEEVSGSTDSAAESFARANIEAQMTRIEAAAAAGEAERLSSTVGGIDFSSAIAGAQALSNALGVSLNTASQIMGLLGGGATPLGTEENSVLDPRSPNFNQGLSDRLANQAQLETIRSNLAADSRARAAAGSGGGGGGGGGGGASGPVSMFPQLAAEVEAATASMEAAKAEQELLNDALEMGIITQQEYAASMDQVIAKYGELEEETKQNIVTLGDFASSMAQTMSNAFMSIIDGTKSVGDAIKDMIKQIISEFIKLAVINPLINSIFGGVSGFSPLPAFGGFAKGSAFGGGRVIPFADGGVVGGPTMFPMKGSRTGLMGESGPEAILPLSRGPGGKLGVNAEGVGGGRPIVFNMSYSFQGGITEADLARATPKIVEQTKRSVVESVQRGGTFAKSLRGR